MSSLSWSTTSPTAGTAERSRRRASLALAKVLADTTAKRVAAAKNAAEGAQDTQAGSGGRPRTGRPNGRSKGAHGNRTTARTTETATDSGLSGGPDDYRARPGHDTAEWTGRPFFGDSKRAR